MNDFGSADFIYVRELIKKVLHFLYKKSSLKYMNDFLGFCSSNCYDFVLH